MKRYLNLGCGNRLHPDWINVDLSPIASGVIKHDLNRPLPFTENTYDVIYLSHVLEHFERKDGLRLLAECYRVCIPGGVIRVVVPDLEMITRLYLNYLDDALAGNQEAISRHHWMTLEIYDQTVRTTTGGETAKFVRQSSLELTNFLQGRIGVEQYTILRRASFQKESIFTRLVRLSTQPGRLMTYMREGVSQLVMFLLWGKPGLRISKEMLFRRQGEIHRWMYDRLSLSNALGDVGFRRNTIYSATESQIENWNDFQLDIDKDGSVYKPDSLFCEGVKL